MNKVSYLSKGATTFHLLTIQYEVTEQTFKYSHYVRILNKTEV